jgi:hypothetical protein
MTTQIQIELRADFPTLTTILETTKHVTSTINKYRVA